MCLTFTDFINYLHEEVANGSIYVLGAQGQQGNAITDEFIKIREHGDAENIARCKATRDNRIKLGYGKTMRAFDCSGLGMYFLQNVAYIFTSDMTANGMKNRCKPVTKNKLLKGDWVFKVDNTGKATHIGYYIGNDLLIEARGRDYGVIISRLDNRFNWYGRPEFWADDIESARNVFDDMSEIYRISSHYMEV